MNYSDWVDKLFGKKGSARRERFEKYCFARNQRHDRLKKSGKWPKVGEIYWCDGDEELHVVVESKGRMVWTQYGNKHIEACGHAELHPDFYAYIGRL